MRRQTRAKRPTSTAHSDLNGSDIPEPGVAARAADPFGTSTIRSATVSAWMSSPTRLREDANVEEDYARGYYRDRVVVELAQNAADAAHAAEGAGADGAGRLLLRLHSDDEGSVLSAANTGMPLSSAGVLALASMRASTKTQGDAGDGSVGHFGVGFSAVRAVSDEITIASTTGAVLFSASATRAVLAALADDRAPEEASVENGGAPAQGSGLEHGGRPGRQAEGEHGSTPASGVRNALRMALERPLADLPILRLPFNLGAGPTIPQGYDTIVVARLRGTRERDAVRHLFDQVDDALLLALPALAEVVIEVEGEPPRILDDVGRRWLTVQLEGHHDPAELTGRPHEERRRTAWRLTWAVPRGGVGMTTAHVHEPHVLHAPTPTDEPCTLPALLVATFPLDPTRRHVAPGAATDALVARAGEAYGDLAERVARAGGDPLDLVPVAPPAGRLDAVLASAALRSLTRRPILRPVATHAPDAALLPPRAAQAVAGPVGHDPVALAALLPAVPDLVLVPRGAEAHARLRAVGVEPRDLADVVDGLPTTLEVQQWRAIYDGLAPHLGEPGVAEALADLPVPLVDGRTVRGPRALVVPQGELAAAGAKTVTRGEGRSRLDVLGPWGLRLVQPDVVHPLLTRLGAMPADARTLLGHPSVRAAVTAAARGDVSREEGTAVADAVLALTADALRTGAEPDEIAAAHPWLGVLPLPDAEGEPVAARELTVPGSWADAVLDGLRPADRGLTERYGPEVLRSVGVRMGLVVLRVPDVVTDEGMDVLLQDTAPEASLDGWTDYLVELAEILGAGVYLGELTVIADLDAVAQDAWPEVLARLASEPAARGALVTPVRSGVRVAPSYASWWLRGFLAAPFTAPAADPDPDPAASGRSTPVPFLRPAPMELGRFEDGARFGREVLAALGAVWELADLGLGDWEAYLEGLPPVDTVVPLESALALWRGLARALTARPDAGLALSPDRLPVLEAGSGDGGTGTRAVVASAEDLLVAGEPMWVQVADVVPAPAVVAPALAVALDVPLAGEDDEPRIGTRGRTTVPTPPEVLAVVPEAPPAYVECEDLTVDDVEVEWWVSGGEVLAATTAGLARGLAQAAGRWESRVIIEAVLADPSRLAALSVERAWDGV